MFLRITHFWGVLQSPFLSTHKGTTWSVLWYPFARYVT